MVQRLQILFVRYDLIGEWDVTSIKYYMKNKRMNDRDNCEIHSEPQISGIYYTIPDYFLQTGRNWEYFDQSLQYLIAAVTTAVSQNDFPFWNGLGKGDNPNQCRVNTM